MLKLFSSFTYTWASLALIVMNLVPLIGVFHFGWNAGLIVFLYWMENVVIGVLNIPKILSCRERKGRRASLGGLLYLAVFFSIHYGLFCFGHYIFIQASFDDLPRFSDIPTALMSGFLLWTLLGLALSHIVSMMVNFYGKGEYLNRSPGTQMFLPYTRIVVLHVVIILGGFLAIFLDEGLGTLILLVLLKTVVDLIAHQVEHSDVKNLINPKITDES